MGIWGVSWRLIRDPVTPTVMIIFSIRPTSNHPQISQITQKGTRSKFPNKNRFTALKAQTDFPRYSY
jgi:hypothetical protein